MNDVETAALTVDYPDSAIVAYQQVLEKIIGSFDRPNIELRVVPTSNKLEAISDVIEPKGMPTKNRFFLYYRSTGSEQVRYTAERDGLL